jgi:hypothetical protein
MEGETKYERMAATATAVTYEDSDDDEFRPREDEEEEEEEATFTAEDYEAERPADDDDERDAYLAREIQGTASPYPPPSPSSPHVQERASLFFQEFSAM